MEDEDYYSRIGIKYDFEGPTRLSYRLIMFYMIGITFGVTECVLAFINYTHITGFCCGLLLFIFSTLGICFVSKIPNKKENRRCWCLKRDNFKESCSKVFFHATLLLLVALVLIMIVIKLINITNDPSLTKFPHQCERAGSCSRVMISDKNHRDHLVNKDNLFTINHLGVENTEDYVEACALDQGQSRLEYKIRNNVTYDTYAYEDPINANKTHKVISYYHINYSSILWGLVDDMSVAVVYCHHVMNPFEKEQLNYQPSIGIEIQSEARFGSDDFESNPSRVADFYDCLSSKIDPAYISNRGSVCNRQSDD